MARVLSHYAAGVLVAAVSLVASVLLYGWTAGVVAGVPPPGPHSPIGCGLKVDGVLVNATGVYVWLRGLGCSVEGVRGYLARPGGASVAGLEPVFDDGVGSGEVVVLRLLPHGIVWGGAYRLVLSGSLGASASRPVFVGVPLPESTVLRGGAVELNGTLIAREAYNVSVLVETVGSSGGLVLYNVSVRVCANPGYTVSLVRGEIYNSTGRPPVWVGVYHVYEYRGEFTYPDCALWYWTPLRSDEQPYTVVVMVLWR